MGTVDHEVQTRGVYKMMDSPIGRLTLVANGESLVAIRWANDPPGRADVIATAEDDGHAVLVETERQLREYFAGGRRTFALPLNFVGTAFQRAVWNALLTIPFGETRSYGQIARHIGNPGAGRAVGAANRRNPLPIVAPCHRVIGATGELTGFAGGLAAKARLLALEGGSMR